MKKLEDVKTNLPIILLSILPISIIIGSSFSLVNTVLLGLCFVFIYFAKRNIKINDIKKYFSTVNSDENYEKSLSILAETKKEVFEFFDNVKVNEDNEILRKNRLELINMLCKTFQNYINFQFLKANNE